MSLRSILLAQGAYYSLTGAAPFVSRRAFEAVTGRKRDWWLVQTIGAVVTPVGVGLVGAAVSGRLTPETLGIAAGCAAGLAGIDVYYASQGRISRMYLVDAACQIAALVGMARNAKEIATRGDTERPRLPTDRAPRGEETIHTTRERTSPAP